MATNFTITPELLDQLLANYEKPEDLTGEDGLFKQLKKGLIERALGAELTDHLGYEKGDPAGRGSGNSRNGTSSKTILTEDGEMAIAIPRDRVGSFEPQLIAKGQTRFDGFDDKILSLYARGMTVREIQGHLAEPFLQRGCRRGRCAHGFDASPLAPAATFCRARCASAPERVAARVWTA
jgi:putative transposase